MCYVIHVFLQVLEQLHELSQSSVTRRSAGLPLIVQSIVASEAKTRQVRPLGGRVG